MEIIKHTQTVQLDSSQKKVKALVITLYFLGVPIYRRTLQNIEYWIGGENGTFFIGI